jgi:S-adenosyl methyltransferase
MPLPFDTTSPNVARIYNALLGGKDNFAADRVAVEQILQIEPRAALAARQNRDFLHRAVRYLVGEAGIRQFLDIGSGLPTADNVHEIAQSFAPESHIVYVDNDPIVLTHARALLTSKPEGECDYVDADFRDTGRIITQAAATLNFDEPVAVLLIAIMHFIPDEDEPWEVIGRLMAAVPPGSFLVVSHATEDHAPRDSGGDQLNDVYANTTSGGVTLRSSQDFAKFFAGLELVSPGVTDITGWRPVMPGAENDPDETVFYGAVGRKP